MDEIVDGRWRLGRSLTSCPGTVFEATDLRDGRVALLRFLDMAWLPSRLLEERRVGALIDHPAILRVLDAGTDARAARAFFVQEAVPGAPLSELVKGGPADPLEAVEIARALIGAAAAAHSKNVTFGRIRAEDVFVDHGREGLRVKLHVSFTDPLPLGEVTPFTPPEHATASRAVATVESDVYVLAALLHHMLSAAPPFEGGDALSLVNAIRGDKPLPLRSELGVPLRIQQALSRALEKKPENRYRRAQDFLAALD